MEKRGESLEQCVVCMKTIAILQLLYFRQLGSASRFLS